MASVNTASMLVGEVSSSFPKMMVALVGHLLSWTFWVGLTRVVLAWQTVSELTTVNIQSARWREGTKK